jgi:hypothetical protein
MSEPPRTFMCGAEIMVYEAEQRRLQGLPPLEGSELLGPAMDKVMDSLSVALADVLGGKWIRNAEPK